MYFARPVIKIAGEAVALRMLCSSLFQVSRTDLLSNTDKWRQNETPFLQMVKRSFLYSAWLQQYAAGLCKPARAKTKAYGESVVNFVH